MLMLGPDALRSLPALHDKAHFLVSTARQRGNARRVIRLTRASVHLFPYRISIGARCVRSKRLKYAIPTPVR